MRVFGDVAVEADAASVPLRAPRCICAAASLARAAACPAASLALAAALRTVSCTSGLFATSSSIFVPYRTAAIPMPAISGPISAGREVRNRRARAEKGPSAREAHECREREHAHVARIAMRTARCGAFFTANV